jgi:ketosteroid isomerase-like protein
MTTSEIGKKLVSLCNDGKALEAIETLYAPEIVSVEAQANPGTGSRESKGLGACLGKAKFWRDNNEIHKSTAQGPFPHGDRFAVIFEFEITPKATGKRVAMKEVGVYTITDGKISREEFFYDM